MKLKESLYRDLFFSSLLFWRNILNCDKSDDSVEIS